VKSRLTTGRSTFPDSARPILRLRVVGGQLGPFQKWCNFRFWRGEKAKLWAFKRRSGESLLRITGPHRGFTRPTIQVHPQLIAPPHVQQFGVNCKDEERSVARWNAQRHPSVFSHAAEHRSMRAILSAPRNTCAFPFTLAYMDVADPVVARF
jgi:hypothetical protein